MPTNSTGSFLSRLKPPAQALDESKVIALQPAEFNGLLTRNPRSASPLMKKLAQSAQSSADKALDLGFLDLQQPLTRHPGLVGALDHDGTQPV
jgi:hypothetical protein